MGSVLPHAAEVEASRLCRVVWVVLLLWTMQAERRKTQVACCILVAGRQAGPHPAEVSEASWLPKFMNLALKSPVSQQRQDLAGASKKPERRWSPGRPLGGPWRLLGGAGPFLDNRNRENGGAPPSRPSGPSVQESRRS